jgi:hypothetical protein
MFSTASVEAILFITILINETCPAPDGLPQSPCSFAKTEIIILPAFLQLPSLEKKRGVGGEFINPL